MVAVLVAYLVGVATGAVVGWNLSKVRKDESLALQPIFRAGPPPEALADWCDPTLRSSVRRRGDAMSVVPRASRIALDQSIDTVAAGFSFSLYMIPEGPPPNNTCDPWQGTVIYLDSFKIQ